MRNRKTVIRRLAIQTTLLGLTLPSIITVTGCGPVTPEIDPVTQFVPVLDEPVRTCTGSASYPNRRAFFGDTHVHTRYSADGYMQGVLATPSDAYDFAKGLTIGLPPYDLNGDPLRTASIDRPLDFAMVSDHAEHMGDDALCSNPASQAYNTSNCQIWRNNELGQISINFLTDVSDVQNQTAPADYCFYNGANRCYDHSITSWQIEQLAAEAAYDRTDDCSFTSFIGYEWTGSPITDVANTEPQNIHRNVLFANAQVPTRPTGYFEAPYPEDLWANLTNDCLNKPSASAETCNVLTIPHNSNLSFGLMFEQKKKNGDDIDAAYATQRALFEPLAEMYQHKGNSECRPGGADEECGFELLDYTFLNASRSTLALRAANPLAQILFPIEPRNPGAPDNAYIRHALKEGLALADPNALGVNPFKYGLIASTDNHIATPGMVNEIDYKGHSGGVVDPALLDPDPNTFADDTVHSAGGLAVVWAEQNTRSSIFAAMQRKEVYATSGPRHELRFFGGWDFNAATLCGEADMGVASADASGVPMGGNMQASDMPDGASKPRFLLAVQKDVLGNDLQRAEIVKGWVDNTGVRHEEVLRVAGDTTTDSSADVNLSNCAPTDPLNEGAAQLCTVWEDNNFDASQQAFYYARVLENPSCRWTQYACLNAGVDCSNPATIPSEEMAQCCDGSIELTLKERSWSSPIWFDPNS